MTDYRPPWCHIRASAAGCFVRFGGGDGPEFRERLEDLKWRVPAAERSYDKESKTWFVRDGGVGWLDAWAERWFSTVVRTRDTPSQPGQRTPPPPPPPRPPVDPRAEAYAVLWLRPGAPVEVVKAAYRVLSQRHHPDHGGDVRTMQAINRAYEVLGRLH